MKEYDCRYCSTDYDEEAGGRHRCPEANSDIKRLTAERDDALRVCSEEGAKGYTARAEIERLRADAERWRFVRDHGLVWLEPPFDGCSPGRVAEPYATRYVDHRLAHETTAEKR